MNEYEKLGQSLIEGKKITEIVLRGKTYKFNPIQSEFISDMKSDFALNAGGYGCVDGKTKIYNADTKEEEAIESLYLKRKAIKVLSSNGKKAQATIPVKYEKTQLFKVKFSKGEIIATSKHRFLTKSGWKELSSLVVGEQLLGASPSLQGSISESYQSILSLGVFRCFQRVLGFLYDCRTLIRSCGGRLHPFLSIFQGAVPLQYGVLGHNHLNYSSDGNNQLLQEYSPIYQQSDPLSKNGSSPFVKHLLVSDEEDYTSLGFFGHSFVLIQSVWQFLWKTLSYPCRVLISWCNKLFCLGDYVCSYPYPTTYDNIVQSITPYKVGNYYDLHVFGTNNYLAEGIFHHNSGKSLALYIKLILFVKCFPGNRVLLGRKTLSDIDRAVLPELFELMPPTWYEHRVKDGLININNGSQIILFGLDAMQSGGVADIKKAQQKLKSLNLGAYFIDQLEEVEYEVFEVLNSRLRRSGVPVRQGNMTCNPANFWAYDYFVANPREGHKLYQSSMYDNKDNLPEDYLRKQEAMGEDYVRRFVKGEWTTDVLLKGTVFAREHIKKFEQMMKQPIAIEEGCEIYEQPKNMEYRMGVDPSEGIVDPSSISVVSFDGRKVAKFNGKIPIVGLADKVKFLYYKYRKPLIVPESNSSGTALIREIRDLRIYRRKQLDYKTDIETEKLGFRTSWDSKQQLITHFQHLLRDGKPKVYDKKTIEEMKVFSWSNEATQQGAGAPRGFHDDDVMSTLLAYWEFNPNKIEEEYVAKTRPVAKRSFQYF